MLQTPHYEAAERYKNTVVICIDVEGQADRGFDPLKSVGLTTLFLEEVTNTPPGPNFSHWHSYLRTTTFYNGHFFNQKANQFLESDDAVNSLNQSDMANSLNELINHVRDRSYRPAPRSQKLNVV